MWSLGFVLSLAATYVILGYNGIRRFNEFLECASVRLQNAASKVDRRVVHPLAPSRYVDNGVPKAVRSWHQYLRGCMRQTSTTTQILDIAEKKLLLRDAMQRTTAYELSSSLSSLLLVNAVKKTASSRICNQYRLPPGYYRPVLDLHLRSPVLSSSWKGRHQLPVEQQYVLDFRQDKSARRTRKPISATDKERIASVRRAGACFRCKLLKRRVIVPHTALPRIQRSARLLTPSPSVIASLRRTCHALHVLKLDQVRSGFLVF